MKRNKKPDWRTEPLFFRFGFFMPKLQNLHRKYAVFAVLEGVGAKNTENELWHKFCFIKGWGIVFAGRRMAMKRGIVCMLTVVLILTAAVLPVWQTEAHALTTTVRVGYCDQMPPYQYTGADGQPRGFHVDVLEYIAEKEDLLLEYEAFGTTSEALDRLEEGGVDIVLGAAAGKYFGYHIQYSNPVSTANLCLVAPKEIAPKYKNENKKYYKVVCEFEMVDFSLLSTLTSGTAIVKGNQMAAADTLTEGHAEMIVGVKDCLLWYFQEHEIDDDYIILNNYLDSADFTIAVRDGDRYLYTAVNENIAVLRTSAEYEKFYNTWLAYDKGVDYQKILKYVLYAGSVCFIFLAAYLIVSYRAKQKLTELVEIRTAELYETNQKLERRTAQVEAENRLRYSIIEASPAGMVLVDEHMHIEYMNSSALQIAGIPTFRSGEVLGRLRIFREILRDTGGKIFAEDWDFKSGSFEFYKDKGHRIRENYRYSIHKMTLSEGDQGALITLENVTAEENEREAAFEKEKNETLNSLIAGIAHEIKNPLTAISASAAMIQEKGDKEKYRQAFSAFIPQEIDRVTRLINSLIDYARPSGSKIELVNLNEIILSVAELAKVTAKKIDIAVEMDMGDPLQFIGDRDKMKQSLLNLVINSAEAIRQRQDDIQHQHRISISAERVDDIIIVRVEDDGVGMSASQLNRCMNPFYTTKPAGTGIGLALTKQYVEEVGGMISVASEKNIFTAVEIQLPAAGGKEGEK